ncbi:pentatricopeptide repeat-containing protein At4g16390, chloroplastic-like [Cynara cardunculus var. scolymus]|uniref:Pentatricopeptide repeat-containing protein n=1 Tax=Cynara cardunculus var. scolymus TaxID=59895 RepID=A0A103XY24_CYNCS|nr:pentatricopeptide repeat-containing protein At4g16390, chloroplastic-like [Cynara cardunculus var. scolymus]KVH98954.1 Pentatricopeptide repeat-containing protein [Cynara cardunculus var. scolymus]
MASTCGFCSSSSISFSRRSLNHRIVFQSATHHFRSTQISLQEPVSEVTNNLEFYNSNLSQLANEKRKKYIWVNPKSSKYLKDSNLSQLENEKRKSYIWVNPKSPKASQFRRKSYDPRKRKDVDDAEQLFDEMLQRGVTPDNTTFQMIIECALMSHLPSKAVAWFERMPEFRIQPDDATYALMIDAYGRVGDVKMALQLYDRSKIEKWQLSTNIFTTLIRIHGTTGNFDGCLTVFEEMRAVGIKPDLICYNTMLDAIYRAKLPSEIKSIHQEILNSGLSPAFATYASLLRAYCKSCCGDEAMNVYNEMLAKGMELNTLLYNTLLRMCVDIGFVDEAASIFEEMKRSRYGQPNSRTFSSLITIFSSCGQVSEAEDTLEEMLEAGFKRDVYVLTDLLQCYRKSNRIDDVVRTLDRITEVDITPNERSCICLLKVMTEVPREEMGRVTRCIERANPKLGNVVKRVVESPDVEDEIFKNEVSEVVSQVGDDDSRRAYCKCLIDLCVYLRKPEKARYVETLL